MPDSAFTLSDSVLDGIARRLRESGRVVLEDFLPSEVWLPLRRRAETIDAYRSAGIGRGERFQEDRRVRGDRIFWLGPDVAVDRSWLAIMEVLRQELNRRLLLGLFEFECHYARYERGAFYRRHFDAFRGEGIRLLSVVFYLNADWGRQDGGELVIHDPAEKRDYAVSPRGGTLVLFLSEEFPHEVLPAKRERFSITGWFRANRSTGAMPDPPL